MLPVFALTVRALARGRRLIVIAVLLAVPALLALAFRASEQHPDGPVFALQLFIVLILPVLLPLTSLIFATAALGNEIEDGTLIYVALRPISRLKLVVAKLLAAALVTVVPVELAVLAMYLLAVQDAGNSDLLLALTFATLFGSVAYCSLFLFLGLALPRRALIVGLGYILAWEGAAAGLSGALATLSIRRYVQGIVDNLTSSDILTRAKETGVGLGGLSSAIILLGIAIGAMGVTTLWLRRMELP